MMTTLSKSNDYRYRAFISYCHEDEKWGRWLHKALERYRVPGHLVGKRYKRDLIPRRLTPIFRDRDELPTAIDLGKVVEEALQDSAFLIVICSPHAARSRWVDEEILTFKRWGRSDRIFCLIVDGEPNAADKPELGGQECFPDALRYVMGPAGNLTDKPTEPIAADVRPQGDGKTNAKLKLIAGILGVGLDELKHREHHRRIQRMAAVTATAMGVMVITLMLAINAIVAENKAERRSEQAEDLISFMLGDLRERLEPIGRLDVLDSVVDKAMEYLASLTEADITDESLNTQTKVLCLIGEVRMAQGDLDQAMSAFADCLASARTLSERAPSDEPRLFQLGQAHFWVGSVHWERGLLDAAEDEFREYLNVSQQLVALNPDNSSWKLELSYARNNLGSVLISRGSLDEALVEFGISIDIKESLVAAHPDNPEWKLALADSYSWLGSTLQARGNLTDALELHRAEVEITSDVLATDPENTDSQRRYSVALQLLGQLMIDLGDGEEAMTRYAPALAIAVELVERDAANTLWQRDLVSAHTGMGRASQINGDVSGALTHFRRAVTVAEGLMDLDTSRQSWLHDAAVGHNSIGAILFETGHPAAARQEANTAIRIIEELLTKVPDDGEAIVALSEAYMLLGQISVETDAGEHPLDDFIRAVAMLDPIASDTTDKSILDPWARALLHVDRVDEARPVVEELHRMGFQGRQLSELCRDKGVLM